MKLVIPSAGTGSRLGEYTKNFNKGLVSVGTQPAIIRIIKDLVARFDIEEIIVLTGYQAKLLEEVISLFLEEINIKIIRVENFSGPNSSLTHTLMHAKEYLDTDFIFCANDTICELPENFNKMDNNWVAYYKKKSGDLYNPRNYRTISLNESSQVTKIYPKDYGSENIYVGMAYIKDYHTFWQALATDRTGIGEVAGLTQLETVNAIEVIQWHDCGMINSLNRAKEHYKRDDIVILDKKDEAIWFSNQLVVKQHIDPKFIADRIKRLEFLPSALVPTIAQVKEHTFSYELISGKVITDILDAGLLKQLLDEMHTKVWSEKCLDPIRIKRLAERSMEFYREKTLKRVAQYHNDNEVPDNSATINGQNCIKISKMLDLIDWDLLISESAFTWFHGDFHNENILYDSQGFKLIDWRQNFGIDEHEYGDVYYDFAKFQHGLYVSHPIVDKELFSVSYQPSNRVQIDILQSNRLLDVNSHFEKWLCSHGYCVPRVRLITALIYLNIAVLHAQPYGQFLYFYGRLLLEQEYADQKNPYFKR